MKKTTRKRRPTKAARTPTFDSLPEMCTPEEARAFLRISRNTMYAALKNLPHVTIGRQIRIHKSVLLEGSR